MYTAFMFSSGARVAKPFGATGTWIRLDTSVDILVPIIGCFSCKSLSTMQTSPQQFVVIDLTTELCVSGKERGAVEHNTTFLAAKVAFCKMKFKNYSDNYNNSK